jgi:hypothetical protein
VLIIN